MKKNFYISKSGLLLICILIITIPSVMAQETPAPSFTTLCGDTNDDGIVDIVDGLRIAQVYVGMNPENFYKDKADVDKNGAIDIVDALLVAQFYVGLIDTLSCNNTLPVLENAFEVVSFTSRAWYGGVYGSGGGTNFNSELQVIIPVVESIQGIWIEDRYYTPSVTNITSPDTIPYVLGDNLQLTFEYRWIPDVPELGINPMEDPPPGNGPDFTGDALILCMVNGETKGFIVETIEVLEPIAYP
ncbi:MAG: hypothetical protein JXJ04_06100 [Spirochaetales bacterium]|nr:hypothetical protein [Spirochaetales bacterium]